MNVIFTCGGTGGHINPAIAVANIWRKRDPDGKILFIGGKGKLEEELVPKAGFALKTLPASGISRQKNLEGLKQNIRSVSNVISAMGQCRKILKDFRPDVVVGTGGYASFPALMTASRMGIPTCVHESNAMPGLTTRMIADRVDRVLVCFPESAKHYRNPHKVEVVGMPVRKEFFTTDKQKARQELGLDSRPLIVSAFGSQGAKAMNEMVGKLFRLEQDAGFPYQHIHAVGSFGWGWMPEYVDQQGVDLSKPAGLTMKQYLYNMPQVMAAADIVIGRAGASTCNEIAASGTPCILIPSPNVTDNHQEKNAMALAERGAAVLIPESDCTAQRILDEIRGLLENKTRYDAMSQALTAMSVPDSAERLCNIMYALASRK